MKRVLLLAGVMMVLGSCNLFRKKNKCHTCPNWKTQTEQAEPQS